MRILKHALILSALGAVASASAVSVQFTFNNPFGASTPSLVAGAGYSTSGNSLLVQTPNAVVSTGATGSIFFNYDAQVIGGTVSTVGWSVDTVIQGFLLGGGTLYFDEKVIELDSNGNEVNPANPIGSESKYWTSASSQSVWSGSILLSKSVSNIRVKKWFFLDATDNQAGPDKAVLGQFNQAVNAVPEPTTMAALGLGAAALLRRRRKA